MLLAFTGRLTPAWALALAALNGLVRPNDLVMRNALIGETIPPRPPDGRARHVAGHDGFGARGRRARGRGALHHPGHRPHLRVRHVLLPGEPRAHVRRGAGAAGAGSRGRALSLPALARGAAGRLGVARAEGRAPARAEPAAAPGADVARVPDQPHRVPGLGRPAALRRPARVPGDATGLGWLVACFSFGALLASIAMVVTGGPAIRSATRSSHPALVRAAARLRPRADAGSRPPGAARHRLRAERRDDLDDRDPAHRLGHRASARGSWACARSASTACRSG